LPGEAHGRNLMCHEAPVCPIHTPYVGVAAVVVSNLLGLETRRLFLKFAVVNPKTSILNKAIRNVIEATDGDARMRISTSLTVR
jgi:hypothetical protein